MFVGSSVPRTYTAAMETMVVTGATNGIGREIALDLAHRGARLVLVCRDQAGADQVRAEIRSLTVSDVEVVVADLTTVEGIHSAADRVLEWCDRIDVLVHGAGIWPADRRQTRDVFELAFAVNHLAPFLMNLRLTERLISSRARVVQVSSALAFRGSLDPDRTPIGDDFHPVWTYANTKLWNLAATLELARRLARSRVTVNAVHPGPTFSRLSHRGMRGAALRLVKRLWRAPEEGSHAPVHLAVSPDVAGRTGTFFDRLRPAILPRFVADPALGRVVWDQTTQRL